MTVIFHKLNVWKDAFGPVPIHLVTHFDQVIIGHFLYHIPRIEKSIGGVPGGELEPCNTSSGKKKK